MGSAFALRAILKSLVLPPLGPLLLIVAGLWVSGPNRRWGRGLSVCGLLIVISLSLPWVSDGLALLCARMPNNAQAVPEHPGVVVVLSGGIRVNAETASGSDLRPVTLARLSAGAGLARRYGLPILLSGGSVEPGPADSIVMEKVLEQAFGLQARFVETVSRNTRENARESAKLLKAAGINAIWLVTSAVHMPRAIAEFQAQGLLVRPLPVAGPRRLPQGLFAWLPQPWALEESHAALYEWLGRWVDPPPVTQ